MSYIIVSIASLLVGVFIGWIYAKDLKGKSLGVLRVDQSDPYDGPYMFLQNVDPDEIMQHKQVLFDVKVEDFVSRK